MANQEGTDPPAAPEGQAMTIDDPATTNGGGERTPTGSPQSEDATARGTGSGDTRPDWVVFGVAGVLALLFVGWGVVDAASLASVTGTLLDGLIRAGAWGFSLAALGFVVFALWLAFSRFGRIRRCSSP